ncbi:MAG: DUF3152 domain-containing protein [Dermatophilaceae bacterium]
MAPTLTDPRQTKRADGLARVTRAASRAGVMDHHRWVRLRRTVVVTVAVLLMGTAVARSAQDPSVPRPDSAGRAPTSVAADPPGTTPAGALAVPRTSPTAGTPVAADQPAAAAEDASDAAPDVPTASTPVQQQASGHLSAVAVPTGQLPEHGRLVRYSVEVEAGIAVDAQEFAGAVRAILTDNRGWQTSDGVRFQPVSPDELADGADVDIRVTLATPVLTAQLCAPLNTTISQVSCWNRGRAVLNLRRWAAGAPTYGTDLGAYRTYLVNHEVGHGLGHQHQHCPSAGQPSPVMVQQTKSLEGCSAWPWPTRP